MKFRQAMQLFLGTAVVIGSPGTAGAVSTVEAAAADVSYAEGINVAFHTRDGFFNVNNDYGQAGCINSRPDGIESFSHGGVYNVKIDGLITPVSYNVNFFDLDGNNSVFTDNATEPEGPNESDISSEPTAPDTYDDSSDTPADMTSSDSSDDTSETPTEFKNEGAGVEITAEPGTLPEGTKLTAVPDAKGCTDTRYTCDLSFVCGGNFVQPNGSVNVKMAVPSWLSGCSNLYVYHVQDGTFYPVSCTLSGGCVSFSASGFSPYVISSVVLDERGEPANTEESSSGISEDSSASTESSGNTESSEAANVPKNPETGIAIAFAPAVIVAAASVAVIRKKK